MFNRRFLRIKILQMLYGFYQDDSAELGKYIKQLHHSVERGFDLYLYLLSLPMELTRQGNLRIEKARSKELLTAADSNPNYKFTKNLVVEKIASSRKLENMLIAREIAWGDQMEAVSRFYKFVRASEPYEQYMADDKNEYRKDRDFLIVVFRDLLPEFDLFRSNFHEKSIYWDEEDFDYAAFLVVNTLKKLGPGKPMDDLIKPVYESREDKTFVETLFKQTIGLNEEIEKEIVKNAKNWDLERIALIDMILIKMTITEVLNFNMIPVKVSMNEYIDIAKAFSSPKSGQFINGITDKILIDLKDRKKFKKVGRGLME